MASVAAVDDLDSDDFFLVTASPLQPSTLSLGSLPPSGAPRAGAVEKLKSAPSFFDAKGLVVEQHEVRRLTGHVRAAPAHRHADVGLAQGRRVVHAVAGHRDDLALIPQGAHDAELVFGADPGEHGGGPHDLGERGVVEVVEFPTRHGRRAVGDIDDDEAEAAGVDPDDPGFRPSRRVIDPELMAYVRTALQCVPPAGEPAVGRLATALLERLVDLHLTKPLRSRSFLRSVSAEARETR